MNVTIKNYTPQLATNADYATDMATDLLYVDTPLSIKYFPFSQTKFTGKYT
jgi:hypothetical protein